MPETIDLIAIGSQATLDHFAVMPSLPGVGDIVFSPGLTLGLKEVYFGGCSLNISLAAARLGAKVSVYCTAGNDFDSSGYQTHLEQFKIDTRSIVKLNHTGCPHCYALYDRQGDGLFFMDTVDLSNACEIAVPEKTLSKTKRLLIVGGSSNSPLAVSCLRTAKKAFAMGIPIALAVIGKAYDVSAEFLDLADMVFCNRFEAEKICESFKVNGFESLTNLGPKVFFITMGKSGSLVVMKEKTVSTSPIEVSEVIDPTGAGDAFTGAALAALLNGFSFEVSAKVGSVVSSFVVEKHGCQTNLPSWEIMIDRYRSAFGSIG